MVGKGKTLKALKENQSENEFNFECGHLNEGDENEMKVGELCGLAKLKKGQKWSTQFSAL